MELMAAIKALESLKHPIKTHIYTDSKYVKDGITQWIKGWKTSGWKTASRKPVKNQDLWKILDAISKQHTLQWHWVRAHSGHPQNERADALARNAIVNAMIEETVKAL
jgi:ribonuclease HI